MHTRIKELVIKFGYFIYKIIRKPINWYRKKFNIETSGVRVMIVHDNSVILVRHWYNGLWVMPGGGMHKYETPEQAAVREIREEIGIEIDQLEYRLGSYSNNTNDKKDTVHCFVAYLSEKVVLKKRFNIEISDLSWFSFDKLPSNTSKPTKQRIVEHLNQDMSDKIRPW